MHGMKLKSRHFVLTCGIALGMCLAPGVMSLTLLEAESPKPGQSASGTFVTFKDGALTIKGKAGPLVYKNIGDDYKTFEDNENGPGSKPVGTVEALSHLVPGTAIRVDESAREISFGLDHRVIGTFVSYEYGRLHLLATDVPAGFVERPAGHVVLTIERNTPILESIAGGDYKFSGPAGKVLETVKVGTLVTARSESDADSVQVIQIGESKRKIERYIGQSRGPVRGTFVSFKDGMLRIRGRGVAALVDNDYDRLFRFRIADDVPVFESIDGAAYQPAATPEILKKVKEGTIITVRKIEEVILDVQIGVAKKS